MKYKNFANRIAFVALMSMLVGALWTIVGQPRPSCAEGLTTFDAWSVVSVGVSMAIISIVSIMATREHYINK